MERSWRPQEPKKKKLGTALGWLGATKGAKNLMGPREFRAPPVFWGSELGSTIGTPFYGFPNEFLSSPMAFEGFARALSAAKMIYKFTADKDLIFQLPVCTLVRKA